MCEADWFFKLIPCLSEAQIKVCDALIQYGRDECYYSTGEPCWTLRASLRVLAADAGIGRASAYTASLELQGMGLLYISTPTKKTGIRGYQLRKMPPRKLLEGIIRNRGSPKIRLGKQIASLKNRLPLTTPGVVDDIPSPKNEDESTTPGSLATSPKIRLVEAGSMGSSLISRLVEIGFTDAPNFVAEHPAERIEAAIAYVDDPHTTGVDRPAAFIRFLVEGEGEIPAPPSDIKETAKLNKYTSGKYGHIVRR